jgi:hypothetical protein
VFSTCGPLARARLSGFYPQGATEHLRTVPPGRRACCYGALHSPWRSDDALAVRIQAPSEMLRPRLFVTGISLWSSRDQPIESGKAIHAIPSVKPQLRLKER